MNTLHIDDIDLSRQIDSYFYKSEGNQLDIGTEHTLIRIKDTAQKYRVKIEIIVNIRFPVENYPKELEPLNSAIHRYGESFESFKRSRNFYELTISQ